MRWYKVKRGITSWRGKARCQACIANLAPANRLPSALRPTEKPTPSPKSDLSRATSPRVPTIFASASRHPRLRRAPCRPHPGGPAIRRHNSPIQLAQALAKAVRTGSRYGKTSAPAGRIRLASTRGQAEQTKPLPDHNGRLLLPLRAPALQVSRCHTADLGARRAGVFRRISRCPFDPRCSRRSRRYRGRCVSIGGSFFAGIWTAHA
jgi:hypothetical protein